MKPNPQTLFFLAAGLGMLGGTSPYAAVNIGRGGLAGLRAYQAAQGYDDIGNGGDWGFDTGSGDDSGAGSGGRAAGILPFRSGRDSAASLSERNAFHRASLEQQARKMSDAADEAAAKLKQEHEESQARLKAQTDIAAGRNPTERDIATGRTATERDIEGQRLKGQQDLEKQREDFEKGQGTWTPGAGADPNDPTKQVPGAWFTPKYGGQPEFHAGAGAPPAVKPGATQQFAESLVRSGAAKNMPSALQMIKDPAMQSQLDQKRSELAFNSWKADQNGDQHPLDWWRQYYGLPPGKQPAQAPAAPEQPGLATRLWNNVFGGGEQQPAQAPQMTAPPMNEREVGKVYPTPKGPMTWTGQGWLPVRTGTP